MNDGVLTGTDTVTISVADRAPVANAGPDQPGLHTKSLVTLDGSGSSDPDGDTLGYSWAQTDGPSVTLSSTTAQKPTFTAPAGSATLTFQLTVSDGELSDSDTVTITTVDRAPVANAGPDQAAVDTNSPVTLDATGSSDPDGDTLGYSWAQIDGPSVTLSSTTAAQPTFNSPASESTLDFQLTVSDGELQATDTVTIDVTPLAPRNVAPKATVTASSEDAAAGQSAAKAVDGFTDGYPDGNATHEWATVGGTTGSWLKLDWGARKYSLDHLVIYDRPNSNDRITGATLTFSDGSTANVPSLPNNGAPLTVNFPVVLTSSVKLTVTSVSSVTHNVGLAEIEAWTAPVHPLNRAPVADAGADQSSVTGGSSVHLDGTGSSDPDRDSLTYAWTQTSGPSVTLTAAGTATPAFTAPSSTSTLTFQLTVSDGALTATDTVTVNVLAPGGTTLNVAPLATVSASSENASTGQQAVKAVDGVASGDAVHEWATIGGKAGSWLDLSWTSPQTIDHIVLYDRFNSNDRIMGATLTFDGGNAINVPALPNNGAPLTVTLPAPITASSVQLAINSVSTVTHNIGLAEIEVWTAS